VALRALHGQAAKGAANVFDDVSPNMNRNLASRLFGAVSRDFEQASEQVAPGLKKALDTANGNFKKFSQSLEFLEKSALGKLVGEDLADAAISGKTVSTTSGESIIKKIKSLPNYEELVKDARDAFERDKLTLPEDATLPGTGSWYRQFLNKRI
jgi:hypothetical protein